MLPLTSVLQRLRVQGAVERGGEFFGRERFGEQFNRAEFVERLAPTKVLLMPDGEVDYFSASWLDLVSLA